MKKKRNSFNIKREVRGYVERKESERKSMREFFVYWCGVTGGLTPHVVNRGVWNSEYREHPLEKTENGLHVYLPEDLQLWEMIGIVEALDYETFPEASGKQTEKADAIREMGRVFADTGVYIAERLNAVRDGKSVARVLSEELYRYGRLLTEGKPSDRKVTDAVRSGVSLTPEETETVDHFLAGAELSAARTGETDGSPEQTEEKRRETLNQFFRAMRKAFTLRQRSGTERPRHEAWRDPTPVHTAFIEKIMRSLRVSIETPEREMFDAVFRYGTRILLREMKESGNWKTMTENLFNRFGISIETEKRKLVDALNVDECRKRLETARHARNPEHTVKVERDITGRIQKAIGGIPFRRGAHNIARLPEEGEINCLGASVLGSSIMHEIGINHLVGNIPGHSFLFLITADGGVEWRDMLYPDFDEKMRDSMLEGKGQDSPSPTVAVLAALGKNTGSGEKIMFRLREKKRAENLSVIGRWDREEWVSAWHPEYGLPTQTLTFIAHNFSFTGDKNHRTKGAEMYTKVFSSLLDRDNHSSDVYFAIGAMLNVSGTAEDDNSAVEIYRKGIAHNPAASNIYFALGFTLDRMKKQREAEEVYRKFLSLSAEENRSESGREFMDFAHKRLSVLEKSGD